MRTTARPAGVPPKYVRNSNGMEAAALASGTLSRVTRRSPLNRTVSRFMNRTRWRHATCWRECLC